MNSQTISERTSIPHGVKIEQIGKVITATARLGDIEVKERIPLQVLRLSDEDLTAWLEALGRRLTNKITRYALNQNWQRRLVRRAML